MVNSDQPKVTLLLTVNETAAALSISRGTVYRLVREERLRPVRIYNAMRFPVTDLEAFIDDIRRHNAGSCEE